MATNLALPDCPLPGMVKLRWSTLNHATLSYLTADCNHVPSTEIYFTGYGTATCEFGTIIIRYTVEPVLIVSV